MQKGVNIPKLLLNAVLVNEGISFKGHLLIRNERIEKIFSETDVIPCLTRNPLPDCEGIAGQARNDDRSFSTFGTISSEKVEIIDLSGYYLLPGLIDTHVHFREPGMTHKGSILSESRAAVSGGVTSIIDMPNTVPPTLSEILLDEKRAIAEKNSFVNYGFMVGVSENNLDEILRINPHKLCGIKLFMGSSTGSSGLDDEQILDRLFAEARVPVVVHAEDEKRISANIARIKTQYGETPDMAVHPIIRDVEACYQSSKKVVELAQKYHTRLHVAHLSTAKELELFSDAPTAEKRITSEVCVSHLWFTSDDYVQLGTKIKCNPAIKTPENRAALRNAVNSNRIDTIATDHAPHTMEEKEQSYFRAPSGIPMIQHSLIALLELVHQNVFTLENVVQKTAHNPATVFNIEKRGFIREGYFADLVAVDMNYPQTVEKSNLLYHCGWSPFEKKSFMSKIICTFVNGNLVFQNTNMPQLTHFTPYSL